MRNRGTQQGKRKKKTTEACIIKLATASGNCCLILLTGTQWGKRKKRITIAAYVIKLATASGNCLILWDVLKNLMKNV